MKIIYRSSLELRFMNFLDTHDSVKKWASEEMWLPYVSPKDRRTHRYFPDFIVEFVSKNGETQTVMIEVKCFRETQQPKVKRTKTGKLSRQYFRDAFIWAINQAKWEAAKKYCLNKQWEFRLITEKDLTLNGKL